MTFEIPDANITINMTLLIEARRRTAELRQRKEEVLETGKVLGNMYEHGLGLLQSQAITKGNRVERFFRILGLEGKPATKVLSVDLETDDGSISTVTIDNELCNGSTPLSNGGRDMNIRVSGLPTFLKIAPGGRINEELPQYGSSLVRNDSRGRSWNEAHSTVSLAEARKYQEALGMVRERFEPTATPTQNPQA
ncbi:MAG: hypothetical protein A2868_02930 [Candidatus Levybacteria bacterium RIFCSPHIGHO2_01_FULL_40_15b]|nr:MAG: hypothetical protein A2868_02930 [Candidatus Levybacteria bacterium RIFCSPHIGHO2_01_FULL_40_15b]